MVKVTSENNQVKDLLLNRRTIRAFKNRALSQEQLDLLMESARQTATSSFLQQSSVIHVTDFDKRKTIRKICQQDYVGANGDLFIFIVDLYRNQQIRKQSGNDDGRLHNTDVFFQAYDDTVLAIQNVANMAESLGLGTVFLGSIVNDSAKMVKILNLPVLTFPVLGLQVGIPDQQPQLKPRLPLDFRTFENEYNYDHTLSDLADYDKNVQTYYDLRNSNQRIDSFTAQINSAKLNHKKTKRDEILNTLHRQELCLH
ncbi:NADPH-flavin oxidoreductase [Ligilactobacillus pobuzihii E100301 = KCTC 13174]|uniref:NADPH-flavin oxidoreductase n=1 Tax=Ligilactobacillus pobuzihii TaxID=449659 RepID=A0A0R2LV25_9LACO|nr:NADPH-flavin oxidoreductase [Ligilactobacillus pobuzihii E100301 = KCTC 13174]KRO02691.1 NADPH-flavin oxidoreductase [Ligilactobacillus pobuzihii]